MTTFFFLLSLLFGWLAWNLYFPIRHHRIGTVVSFLSGWLTGELALHHVAWQVLLVGLLVWADAVDGFLGMLGFLVCIASWLSMVAFYVKSDGAALEMESALAATFGSDYRARIPAEYAARFPSGPDYGRILSPWRGIPDDVEVLKNVPFGTQGLALDIYRPRQSLERCPVLMQIHGGAWTENMGSKNEQAIPLMCHMAQRNWIAVAVSYRLSPTATFPEHVIDCKEALVWIKDNIADYGGDPEYIAVTGGSAGGHLSSLVALTPGKPEFQPGFEDRDTTVQAAVPFYGLYDFTNSNGLHAHFGVAEMFETSIMKRSLEGHPEQYRDASPYFQVGDHAPPFLIIHGDRDSLIPVEEARVFRDELAAVSKQPVVYAEIWGGQHAFDMFPSLRSEHVKNGVERFLTLQYTQWRAGQAPAIETADTATDPD